MRLQDTTPRAVRFDLPTAAPQHRAKPARSWSFFRRKALTERDIRMEYPSVEHSPAFIDRVRRTFGQAPTPSFSFHKHIPITRLFSNYNWDYVNADVIAGISEGIMSIPMGMSYALLAGLPPVYGLYNSFFYPIVYMIFGTARQVSVGVSAVESLLVMDAVRRIVPDVTNQEVFIETANALCLAVACVYLCMRLLGLGIISNFLSDPVLSGFSTGSAVLIGTSQLSAIVGIKTPSGYDAPQVWWYLIQHIKETNLYCVAIAVGCMTTLLTFKYINQKWCVRFPLPGPLVVVTLSALLSWIFKLEASKGVPVIADIPAGFPSFGFPGVHSDNVLNLFRQAVPLTVVFFVVHISIAKTVAQRKGYQIDPSQELVSLTICNAVGSVTHCFPCASSLSRTAVVTAIGSQTILHNVPYALVVLLTMVAITPLLYHLPFATLGSVVLFGVYGMMAFREGIYLCRAVSLDAVLWWSTLIVTVVLGPQEGIIVAIIFSILWLLKQTARPSITVLGRLPNTSIYRSIERFPVAEEVPGVKIFRFESSINFSNAEYFESFIYSVVDNQHPRVIVVDVSSVTQLDLTSVRMLKRVAEALNIKRTFLVFANWRGPLRDYLHQARFHESVPEHRCFLSLRDAVYWAQLIVDSNTDYDDIEKPCSGSPRTGDGRVLQSPGLYVPGPWRSMNLTGESRRSDNDSRREEDRIEEWDGLSAHTPQVRWAHERVQGGAQRQWPVFPEGGV